MYESDRDVSISDEDDLINWYKKIAYSLILGFLFPIYFSGFMGSKLIFPNITLLGKGGFLADFSLLYPLITGVLTLIIVKTQVGFKRAIAMLSIIILPFFIMHILKKDILASVVRGSFNASLIIQLIILSVIGMYIGAKTIIKFDSQTGRLIGGVSSIAFLIFILLPIESRVPVFFSLFKMLKFPGSMKFIVVILIIVCCTLMYSALLGIVNFKRAKNTYNLAEKKKKMIFISVFAIPIILMLQVFFTAENTSFTLVIKILLLFGGFIALVAESLWDMVENSQPKIVRGGDLM